MKRIILSVASMFIFVSFLSAQDASTLHNPHNEHEVHHDNHHHEDPVALHYNPHNEHELHHDDHHHVDPAPNGQGLVGSRKVLTEGVLPAGQKWTEQGSVFVEFCVNESGQVTEARILDTTSIQNAAQRKAAQKAVESTVYEATKETGVVCGTREIVF